MKISVVIPVYGCKGALEPLYERLTKTLAVISEEHEIILVNDACPQDSWEIIQRICLRDKRVVGVNLSRNFGQIKAITAGLDNSDGDWVVVMDCDLQDRPEEIVTLYKKAQEGYDVVLARRAARQDSLIKRGISKLFYHFYNLMTEGTYDPAICNFSISKRQVIDEYCKLREFNRAFTIFLMWMGFKKVAIDIPHDVRSEGKSSYDFRKRLRLAFEIVTAQSNVPLRMSIKIGAIIATVSLAFIVVIVVVKLRNPTVSAGWTSLIASIYLMGGLLLMNMGIVGLYVGNIFNEVKCRPLYIIRDLLNKPKGK